MSLFNDELNNIIIDTIDNFYGKNILGRPKKHDTTYILKNIFYVLRTGCQWSQLNSILNNYSYKTIHKYFIKWSNDCIFKKSYIKILNYGLENNKIDLVDQYIDSTSIKNIFGCDVIGSNYKDKLKNGTKMTSICDNNGITLGIHFSKANIHDNNLVEDTIKNILIPNNTSLSNKKPKYLIADAGYDSNKTKNICKKYGYRPIIAKNKRNNKNNKNIIKISQKHKSKLIKRHIIENTYSWLDLYRRLILRYDSLLICYESFTYLALCNIVFNKFKKI
jgi:transposase